jgi:predicted nucleotidyltransferase
MLKKSSSSVSAYFLDRTRIRGKLDEACQLLVKERPAVRSILLFGSFARGRAVPGSDLDLAIVIGGLDSRPWPQRTGDFLPYFAGLGVPVDLFCYTQAEWQEGLSNGNPLFAEMAAGELLGACELE